jgi:Gpi18-like mannosyltransferase
MYFPFPIVQDIHPNKRASTPDGLLLGISIILQLVLALFFGHAYDMRIFMATGYLVGTGQNPYIAQNLASVFQNNTFQGITSFGYPPPYALVLGLIYLVTYHHIHSLLLYNLAVKLPIIAANLGLAYLLVHVMDGMGVQRRNSRRAWLFFLFNPFLLISSSAWGQFDSVVSFFSLLSLFLLNKGKTYAPAVLLALAISFKPVALPLIPVIFVYLLGTTCRRTLQYSIIFIVSLVLFCAAPFVLFQWDPSVIFQHWNAHFSVGGGLSFMTFLEALNHSYQLPGSWWIMGWCWVPALCIAAFALKPGINGFKDLLKKSLALILVFFLCRAWLSEPNVILVLPFVLILTCVHELNRLALAAVWILPFAFGLFNTSIAQLFFPSLPAVMDGLLKLAGKYNPLRFALRTVVVIGWLTAGWWIVYKCYKKNKVPHSEKIPG